jgi:hypothetical protein
MNITHKELCELYRAHLDRQIPVSRKKCPATKDLLNLFNSRTRERRKAKVVDHLSRCMYCTHEFSLLIEIKRGTNRLDREIDHCLKTQGLREPKRFDFVQKPVFLRAIWRYAVLGAGMLVLSAGLVTLFQIKTPLTFRVPIVREIRGDGIQVLAPGEGIVSKSRLVFRWKTRGFVDHYILEVFDDALSPVFRSPEIKGTFYLLPKDLAKRLSSQRYFWMISGFAINEKVIESRLCQFFLTE